MDRWKNLLYFGDNLEVLRKHIPDESVDLIYLDPPWNSKAKYNVIFEEPTGEASPAQVTVFEDTWKWNEQAEALYHEMVTAGPERVSLLLQSLRSYLGRSDIMAYLANMAPRLVELRRVLKPGGSLYYHCDPTASHYIKLLLDAVFGPKCFRNEIIWSYRRWPSPTKAYQSMHDVIFFYSGTPDGPRTFNVEYEPNSPSYIQRFKGKTQVLDPVTRTRKLPVDAPSRGLARRDVWELPIIAGSSRERLGYPTQKPEKLLDRIIRTSSNENDLVLDPFCGCGTTVAVAERLKRRWIGIDITYLAINLIRRRLEDAFRSELLPYEVRGIPVDLPSAAALAQQNRHQFQWWAVDMVNGRPYGEQKKGADQGIDGVIYFFDDVSGRPKKLVIQVKSGHVSVRDVRDLQGVMEREKAPIGALITLEPPTRAMIGEAVSAGFYIPEHPQLQHTRYPRVQILTVVQILSGQKLAYPKVIPEATYKRAQRRDKVTTSQQSLYPAFTELPTPAAAEPQPQYGARARRLRRGIGPAPQSGP